MSFDEKVEIRFDADEANGGASEGWRWRRVAGYVEDFGDLDVGGNASTHAIVSNYLAIVRPEPTDKIEIKIYKSLDATRPWHTWKGRGNGKRLAAPRRKVTGWRAAKKPAVSVDEQLRIARRALR